MAMNLGFVKPSGNGLCRLARAVEDQGRTFGNWDRNASLDIAMWGHRQDWRLQDRDLTHLRCRGGTICWKADVQRHVTSFCWYCWYLQVASWAGHGLPTDELCVQIHGCMNHMNSQWNLQLWMTFGYPFVCRASPCLVSSVLTEGMVSWSPDQLAGHSVLTHKCRLSHGWRKRKRRRGKPFRKSIQLPSLPGKVSSWCKARPA